MKTIHQQFAVRFQYDVSFTHRLFSKENTLLADFIKKDAEQLPAKVYLVIDDGVSTHHPTLIDEINDYFQRHQQALSLCCQPLVVPGGEQCKISQQWVDRILKDVNEHQIDRHSYIAAIGGGALLDMVGFAASIAHRGVRHIRIPTTVLSQNDSGVGVKNAINFFGKKNFIGTFAPPVAVFNDLHFLTTLDDREWRAGISEAIKVGLIKDADFFKSLEEDANALARRDMAAMERLIHGCAQLHMEHIAGGDPFEMGSSRPLDFGHWAAHKLEQLSNYELRHGEAVAIGIALDTTYSYFKDLISDYDWRRVIRLIQAIGFDVYTPHLEDKESDRPAVLQGLNEFREHLGGQLTIMLLADIGQGREVHDMEEELILRSIGMLQKMQAAAVS